MVSALGFWKFSTAEEINLLNITFSLVNSPVSEIPLSDGTVTCDYWMVKISPEATEMQG